MVPLKCPECGSSRTGHALLTDEQVDRLARSKDPRAGVFRSGKPLYICPDCETIFASYLTKDLVDRDMDFETLMTTVLSSMDDDNQRVGRSSSDIDLMFEAESAHGVGDEARARQYLRLLIMNRTGDEGLEDAVDAMMEDGDVGERLELTRWLLGTLSRYEEVPAGIWDVHSEATGAHDRGDDDAAAALLDRLVRTADERLIAHWDELREHMKVEYKSNKKRLDRESRKRFKALMWKANAWMASDFIFYRKKALRCVREAHGILDAAR